MARKIKRMSLLAVAVLLFFLWTPVQAEKTYVFDEDQIFSESELLEINAEVAAFSEEHQIDFIVLFLTGIPADTKSIEYHRLNRNFMAENDFGQGEEKTAVMLSVDMSNRYIQVTAHGEMYPVYAKTKNIETVIRKVGSKLRLREFKGAIRTFMQVSLDLFKHPYKAQLQAGWNKMSQFSHILASFGIGLVVMIVFLAFHNKNKAATGLDYEKTNSFQLLHKVDQFLYMTKTSHRVESDSSSDGGGGVSNDSDGSYSGGGGSF